MDLAHELRPRRRWLWWYSWGVSLVLAVACGASQIPPGPAPEYERPELAPWDAGAPADPLSTIEAEGEWVDDDPVDGGAAGAASNHGAVPSDGATPNHNTPAVTQGTDDRSSPVAAPSAAAPANSTGRPPAPGSVPKQQPGPGGR